MSKVTSQARSALTLQPNAAVSCPGASFFCLKSTASMVGLGLMALLHVRGGHETDVSLIHSFP